MTLLLSISSLITLKGVVAAFLLYYALWIVYTRTFHPLAKFKGPFWASITRFWFVKDMSTFSSEKTQLKNHAKYGPIVRIAPDELTISDPQAINIIYGVKPNYDKTDFWAPLANDFGRFSSHVSNINTKEHGARRKIVNGIYSMTNVLKSEQYLDVCIAELERCLSNFAQTGSIFNWTRWAQLFSFDVLGELYFSNMFGFMSRDEDHQEWIESIDSLMPFMTLTQVSPKWFRPLMLSSTLLSASARKAAQTVDRMRTAAISAVEGRIKLLKDDGLDNSRQDMLGQMFGIYHEKGEKVDFQIEDIQVEVWAALMGGSDTTAVALSSAFHFLLKHPRALKKLVQELDEATAAGQLSVPFISYNEAAKLPYLDACLKESARLHPSSAMALPRHVPEGGVEISGQFIPGGTRVGINPYVVMKDKGIFGQDAESYNPDRWMVPGAAENMDKYMFQYSMGAHTCLGKNIAQSEIYKVVSQLFRSFEFELVEPERVWHTASYSFYKPDKLDLRVKKRNL